MTLDDMQRLHSTATVEQVKNSQLFLVTYPGLVLAISYELLIAFNVDDEWHISTEKMSKSSSKHYYHLLDILTIKHWYTSRRLLLAKLKDILGGLDE
jgi:hypothetical protein